MKTEITPEQKSRSALIKERQKNSLFWQVVHLLGSLQLALILLATIALACAIATLTESRYDTQTAQTAIYKAPWFMAWLTVLCINLFAVTLTRWPWERKHVGFIITHYGIIALLIGAMIGMSRGFEGNVTLHRGTPVTKITTRQSVIQIESPADSYLYLLPYDAAITRPSIKHPTKLSIPGTDLQLIIDDWSNHLEQQPFLQASNSPKVPAALLLALESKMLHQKQIVPLTLADTASATFDFFGLATVQLLPTLPEPHSRTHRESQIVAAKFAPVIVTEDQPSDIHIMLSDDGNLVTVANSEGTSASYSRADLMHQKLPIGSATIEIKEYWPDFKLVNGKPTTLSQQAKNPALRAEILFPSTTAEPPAKKTTPWLRMALNQDFKSIQYQLGRGSSIQKSGTLALNTPLPLGWADWQGTLLAAGPHEEITYTVTPLPKTTDMKSDRSSAPPGFHAYLIDRQRSSSHHSFIFGSDPKINELAPKLANDGTDFFGNSQWVMSGSVTPLTLNQQMVRVAYGLELKSVPFSIELLHFEVPRDEGTETPSDFRATVRFQDLKTGAIREGLIHMNHPASFPGTFLANLTGINYKFSQAEWNPRDLDETTLQVLYDPGWLFKWIGSLAICIGIAMMFYWKKRK
ncbi:MAG: hypothetical protein FJ390_03455 [Verrucomicrobia bacterium]|nr:hypothetical protein [Verrucomicrobiota bacterium]